MADDTTFRFRTNRPRRGRCVIISNKKFQNNVDRDFTDVDLSKVYSTFAGLGFDIVQHKDKKGGEIETLLQKEAALDHTDEDCFVCVVLSYGDHGVIDGTDRPVQVDNVLEHFKGHRCQSLAGKPKIFIFQACNPMVYRLTQEQADSDTVYRIPSEADFLLVWSVVPGNVPWRNTTGSGLMGSCYIDNLCRVLGQHGREMELTRALTIVNRRVAEELEKNAPQSFDKCGKRLPCIINMLTKEVYFPDKS